MKTLARKNDFVEIKYTGYAQGNVFDSNIEEDLKTISETKPQKTIVVIGKGMVVPGLDKALDGKEIEKEYLVTLSAEEGFGQRKRELMKTIPLRIFHERKIEPRAGMMLTLDDMLVKIIAVSGARVIADFNNPLAGKELSYKFTLIRKIDDEREKTTSLFAFFLRFVPDFTVGTEIVMVRGPKELEVFVQRFREKFREIMKKELEFELEDTVKEHEKAAGSLAAAE